MSAVTGPTLHIDRNGNWWVERPHATGSDVGPAGYARRGERLPDADVQVQIDYYRRAGFHIDDKRARPTPDEARALPARNELERVSGRRGRE